MAIVCSESGQAGHDETGQTQSGEEVSQTGEEALAIVSTPKFPFVRVKIHDLIDDSATSGYS
jgi:hypothetical protein